MSEPAEHTVLGLPILNPGPDGIPIDALVIARYLDKDDGGSSHRICFTSNLDVVDAMGRLHWALLVLEEGVLTTMDDDDDEDGDNPVPQWGN